MPNEHWQTIRAVAFAERQKRSETKLPTDHSELGVEEHRHKLLSETSPAGRPEPRGRSHPRAIRRRPRSDGFPGDRQRGQPERGARTTTLGLLWKQQREISRQFVARGQQFVYI